MSDPYRHSVPTAPPKREPALYRVGFLILLVTPLVVVPTALFHMSRHTCGCAITGYILAYVVFGALATAMVVEYKPMPVRQKLLIPPWWPVVATACLVWYVALGLRLLYRLLHMLMMWIRYGGPA